MHFGRIVRVGAVALVLGACSGGGGGGTTGPNPPDNNPPTTPGTPVASASVTAGANDEFTPRSVDLRLGGTVTWSFGARAHEVGFQGTGAPADIPTTTGAQVSRTFGTAGTFNYSCSLHPGMNGTIRVVQ
ncbi:MAG TPA: hypothetical protein VF263_19900 [Longimicrobiaceae bacterium]